MKKLIIFLMTLLPLILSSQNLEPEQLTFYLPAIGKTIPLSSTNEYFQQTKFVKGVHWDYSKRLGQVLGMSQQDIYDWYSTDLIKDNSLLHVKPSFYTHCQEPDILNARGIEYSPILTINPDLTHTVQKCTTNTTSTKNQVFGFQTIVGTKDTTNDCLVIDSSVDSNTVILEEPWTADQFSSKSVS